MDYLPRLRSIYTSLFGLPTLRSFYRFQSLLYPFLVNQTIRCEDFFAICLVYLLLFRYFLDA